MHGILELNAELSTVVEIIHDFFELDVAIFDIDNKLITSTKNYINIKGKNVHSASIQEVIQKGTVVVTKPGTMRSCDGCRFKNNCPSTIEILSCINVNASTVGVISLASFSKETHKSICTSIDTYIKLINKFSNLISMLVSNSASEYLIQKTSFINTLANTSNNGVILIDKKGDILNINQKALNFFSSCNFYIHSAFQILPAKMMTQCLSGTAINDYIGKIQDEKVKINCTPVINNNNVLGAIIKISNKNVKDIEDAVQINTSEAVDNIIGNTPEINLLKDIIRKICDSPSTVLITGETGTGKGLIANTIHMQSSRRNKPFVYINCAAIPSALFESELFGYESGAFTGAKKSGKLGKFELAKDGTIFLDEIGELSIEMQTKLLGVLQDFTFERVGGITPISMNARVIAATDINIKELIDKKKFRKELFYRLNVIPIKSTPLRERKEDIPLLVSNFISLYNVRLKKKISRVDLQTEEILKNHYWEGNIRELMNTIEYTMNICETDIITKDFLPKNILNSSDICNKAENILKDNELKIINELLNKYGNDVKGKTKVAEELGITLRTLYRKINGFKKENQNL